MHVEQLEALFARQRAMFPGVAGDLVHLNNAAGSEMPEQAIEAMTAYMRSGFVNEGRIFPRLAASAELNRQAHLATADFFKAAPEEVALLANTTTALFTVSRSLARLFRAGERILISEACHEANIAPWLALREHDLEVEFIPMREDTHLDYEWLEANIDERTRLVSVGSSSNATGTIHDIARVRAAARRVGAWVSLDAAHHAPHLPLDVRELDVDLVFFSIYKCFGPHLGAVYIRRELLERLEPYTADPGPPGEISASRFNTGTRNLEAYAGWLGTIEYLQDLGRAAAEIEGVQVDDRREALTWAMRAIGAWERELTRFADPQVRDVPGIVLYQQPADDARPRLGVFELNLTNTSPAQIAEVLRDAGIEGVFGNHGAVRTMRRFAADFGGIGVRLSLAHYNNRSDLQRSIAALRDAARQAT